MKLAVIGIGCRFPGNSNSPEEFFQNLLNGVDCVREIPQERWNKDFYYDQDKNRAGKMVMQRGGFIEGIYDFDNEAFNMSAKEATNIDPQQRILLETTLQALEDANITYQGTSTGVFIGSGASDFTQLSTSNPYYVTEYTAPGGALSIHSNRISYAFDLRGPSMAIDTACSASGTAMYVASQCIENGDCDQAIVGGINILMNQSMSVAFSKLGVLSPEGKSKSFDASANGYVRSEGCGVVVVKPLEKAIEDGNHIYCVLHSIGTNEDGAQSPSLTMPSGEAQRSLIQKTLKKAGICANDIFFVEAHATGTLVGDPIEMNTLGSIYGVGRGENNPLRVGAVKTNIGHMEFASFMASLIKCALMMDREVLVPSIHFKKPNPKIDFEKYNMLVQTKPEKFNRDGKLFSISSFGFGGANVCAILEAPPRIQFSHSSWKLQNTPFVFLASALTKSALQERISQYKSLPQELDQHRLMTSLNNKKFDNSRYLSYALGGSMTEAKFVDPIRVSSRKEPIVFVFSGQGPQNIDMGRVLYKSFPAFKKIIDQCDAMYKENAGFSLIHDIGLFGDKVGDKNSVNDIRVTLPGLIFMQIGLFELYQSFGLKPDAIIGHSFGEMCAIYASKACSLEAIINVTIKRAELMTHLETGKGTMIALGCSHEEYKAIVEEQKIEGIWIAAINSPQSVTAGGLIASVHKLAEICQKKSIFNRVLNVTNAYHTPLMSSLKDIAHQSFKDVLAKTSPPSIPVVSTVTGQFWSDYFTPEYFWSNIENAVYFQKAVETSLERFGSECIFLEMAPHPVLSMSIKQCGAKNIIYSQHRNENQQGTVLQAVAKLHAFQYHFNWNNIIGVSEPMTSLPTYPFQRKTFFNENEIYRELRLPSAWGPMIGSRIVHHEKTFQNFVSTKSLEWLEDHVVQDAVIFPAAAYVEIALEALGNHIQNIEIKSPMTVPTDSTFQLMQTSVNKDNSLTIFSKREGDSSWTEHAVAKKSPEASLQHSRKVESIEDIKSRCLSLLERDACYKRFEVMKLKYGFHFQCIDKLYQGDEESLGVLSTSHLKDLNSFTIHPAVLDCCFQCFLGTVKSSAHTYLPTGLDQVLIHKQSTPDMLYVHCQCDVITEKSIKGSVIAFDNSGDVLFEIQGFLCTLIPRPSGSTEHYYQTLWQSKRFPDFRLTPSIDLVKEKKTWKQVIGFMPQINKILAEYISNLDEKIFERKDLPESTRRHLSWCKGFVDGVKLEKNMDMNQQNGFDTLAGFELELSAIHRIGKVLEDLILNKDNSVMNVMFSDDLMAKLYSNTITFEPSVDMMADLISQIPEQKRVIRILEIGAGTGTMARKLLPELKKLGTNVEYYFTDVSSSFFTTEKKFKEYSFVQYKVVNIEKPLSEQGFANESLDIVLGFDVVHTSSNLEGSLSNIQSALAPNGLMMLIEPTSVHPYMHFIFGIFREWWGFTDDRSQCCLNDNQWQSILPRCGFENIDFLHLEKDHVHSIILARKRSTESNLQSPAEAVTVYKPTSLPHLLSEVQDKIKKCDNSPVIIVTRDAQMESACEDNAAYVGFGRVLANEYNSWKVRLMDVPTSMGDEELEKWINIVKANLDSFETEFAIRENQVFVPRLRESLFSSDLASANSKNSFTPFRLEISDGLVDNIKFHQVRNMDDIPEGRVLVRVKAAALNFRDIMLAMKMLEYSAYLGLEFAGVIEKVGPGVTKYKVGDEVYGLGEHCLASHVIANQVLIVKKPKQLTFEEAASIPIVFITVYYAFFCKTSLQEGQKVLVHSGAGGVGQAAIQLLHWKGCEVFTTVGSQSKRTFLQEKYGVQNFANSHSRNWDQEIRELAPDGVDIVLNSLNGENIEKGLRVLSPCGSFIEIGKRDIMDKNHMPLEPFINNLSYYSVHLDFLIDKQPAYVGGLLQKISDLFDQKVLSSFVDSVFPAKDIVSAIRYMQSGKHVGKIVLNFDELNYPPHVYPPIQVFRSDKTYVMSGGLGAVGFELTKFMVKNGARHICLMSRSGKLTKYQKRTLKQLEDLGAQIIISKTDVCNSHEVNQMYEELNKKQSPPIGGVFHLAMVLDDAAIPKQSDTRLEKVFDPKVKGAKNLLQPLIQAGLGNRLDFVVMFSSISSILGNPEQSNYASANAVLDAYATKLVRQGINAKVINLGAVDDVGVIATDFVLRKIMLARGLETMATVSMVQQYIEKMLSHSETVQLVCPINFGNICEYNPAMAHRMQHLVRHVVEEEETSMSCDLGGDVGSAIARRIEKILQLDPMSIDETEKLTTYGVDSLLAVEISSMLAKTFSLKVSQMDILSGLSVRSLKSKYDQKK